VLEWARSPIQYVGARGWPDAALRPSITAGMRDATLRHYTGLMRSGIHQNLRDQRVDPEFSTAGLSEAANRVNAATAVLQRLVRHGMPEEVAAAAADAHREVDALAARGAAVQVRADNCAALTAKKYMYAVLPALYITWMQQHAGLPPLDVEAVLAAVALPPAVASDVRVLLAAKRRTAEKGGWQPCLPVVDAWLHSVDAAMAAELKLLTSHSRAMQVCKHALVDLVMAAEAGDTTA
jgi:predicted nucleotidyltransferase